MSHDGHTHFERQENRRGFANGNEHKPTRFQKRRRVYKPPSLVLRPPLVGQCVPKEAATVPPTSKEAGKRPWGLPALMTAQQDRAGGQWRRTCTPFILTIDGLGWDCYIDNCLGSSRAFSTRLFSPIAS